MVPRARARARARARLFVPGPFTLHSSPFTLPLLFTLQPMILTLALATALTAVFHPARPTVGDPIVIEFREPVVLDPSPQYEIVSTDGKRVVVRTFSAKPFALSGHAGQVKFRNLVVPVQSVLKAKD